MLVFRRSTSFRQGLTASRNKALPGKKKKKSDEQQLQTRKCSSMCLRSYLCQVTSFSEQVIRLRITMSSLVPPVLRKLRLTSHAHDSEDKRCEEISGDPPASRVVLFSCARTRVVRPPFCLSAKVPTPCSLLGEK